MAIPGNKKKKTEQLHDKERLGRKSWQKFTNQNDIDHTRLENRREADLEDKNPAGDAGVEDNRGNQQEKDSPGESNY